MTIIIPLLLAVNQLLVAMSEIFRFLPDVATRNLFTVYPNRMFLTAQAGVVVQFIWVITIGLWALWLNAHRDVSKHS
jgi:hypothetical protein